MNDCWFYKPKTKSSLWNGLKGFVCTILLLITVVLCFSCFRRNHVHHFECDHLSYFVMTGCTGQTYVEFLDQQIRHKQQTSGKVNRSERVNGSAV